MTKLHIPLHTQQTTRRSARVVWHYGILGGLFALSIWIASSLWSTRVTLDDQVPTDAVAAVFLPTSARALKAMPSLIRNLPLVSDRPITLEQAAPYAGRELAIFFRADGTHFAALSKEVNEDFKTILKSNDLVAQERDKQVILDAVPRETVGMSKSVRLPIRLLPFRLTKSYLGTLVLPQNPQHAGVLLTREDSVLARFAKSDLFQEVDSSALPELVAALQIKQTPFAGAAGLPEPTRLLLTSDENGMGFLVAFSLHDVSFKSIGPILQEISAKNHPNLKEITLPDGSTAKEMIVDPTLFSVESLQITGRETMRVPLANGYLFASEDKDNLLLTNRISFLENTSKITSADVMGMCGSQKGFIQVQKLLKTIQPSDFYSFSHALYAISGIGMNTSFLFQDVRVCLK